MELLKTYHKIVDIIDNLNNHLQHKIEKKHDKPAMTFRLFQQDSKLIKSKKLQELVEEIIDSKPMNIIKTKVDNFDKNKIIQVDKQRYSPRIM